MKKKFNKELKILRIFYFDTKLTLILKLALSIKTIRFISENSFLFYILFMSEVPVAIYLVGKYILNPKSIDLNGNICVNLANSC